MQIHERMEAVVEIVKGWKKAGETVAFVPTMGYLHEGHLSLIRTGFQHADRVVVSIYVNPTQFDRSADLQSYPRDMESDAALCEREGVDLIFTPTNTMMYPEHYRTYVHVETLTERLCGATRPGHFRGVTTIVAKLFNIVQPDVAVFGQKDYQQLKVIERMVEDLNMPITIVPGPTLREDDGLAMSSRNARLTPEHRKAAPGIYAALQSCIKAVEAGERNVDTLISDTRKMIMAAGAKRIDYIDIIEANDLMPLRALDNRPAQMAVAVFFGDVRLIDNVSLYRP